MFKVTWVTSVLSRCFFSGKSSTSLFWLLKEPLVYGARLDVCSGATPGLMAALCRTKTLVLKQPVDPVGPALTDSQAVGRLLGIHSTRVAQKVLEFWRQRLSGWERSLLIAYSHGTEPDHSDTFPEVHISPQFGELVGPLLQDPQILNLHTVNREIIYQNCAGRDCATGSSLRGLAG